MILEKQKIRVSTGIVIEVNDAGETITMNVDDQMFLDRFSTLIEEFRKIAAEMDQESIKNTDTEKQVALIIDRTKSLMDRIDDVFGDECCRKVFGNAVPGPYALADFFDQLMPIAEQYMDERQKEISKKYNRTRRGAHRV